MPIYEFKCEYCGQIFEVFLKSDEGSPSCLFCKSENVVKIFSIFGFQDKGAYQKERERNIIKRVRDYVMDGKIDSAKNFMEKAKEFHPTDRIKRLSEALHRPKRKAREVYIGKPELVIFKKKG